MAVDARFYTTEKLGPKRELTPEGFLICYDVPVARIGEQLYGPGETPIEAGEDGVVHIQRDEDQVFHPDALSSFNGKPVVFSHPSGGEINPSNWMKLAVGVALNPRRGQGEWKDFMLEDFLITREDAVGELSEEEVDWEVSGGYDADYEQIEGKPGYGRQVRIIGNHIALVKNARCGPRCSIQDSGDTMKDWKKKLTDLFKTKDEAAFIKALDSLPTEDEDTHLHFEGRTKFTDEELEKRFSENDQRHQTHDQRYQAHDQQHKTYDTAIGELQTRMAKLQPGAADAAQVGASADAGECPECGGTGKVDGKECPKCHGTGKITTDTVIERGGKTLHCHTAEDKSAVDALDCESGDQNVVMSHDSSPLQQMYQVTVAAAEVISPGIHLPTFDSKMRPLETYKSLCGLRRKSLQTGMKDEAVQTAIKEVRGGRSLDEKSIRSMNCQQVHDLFFPVAALMKRSNNSSSAAVADTTRVSVAIRTPADLNKINAERWKI